MEENMEEYHKIQTVFLRDPDNKYKTLLLGRYAKPEFEFLQACQWYWTEKVDGTNIRVMWDGESVAFGGKTDRAQIPAQLVNALTDLFPAERLDGCFDGPVCLYGEGYGAKIQKGGGNYRPDQSFVLFDIKAGGWWFTREDVIKFASRLGIESVPVIGSGDLREMQKYVADGFDSMWGSFPAEGIVARPGTELQDRGGHRIITKLKTKDFG
jgi:hypothetical protein